METAIQLPRDFSQHKAFYEGVQSSRDYERLVNLEYIRARETGDENLLAEKLRLLKDRRYKKLSGTPLLECPNPQVTQVFRSTYRRSQDALEQLLLHIEPRGQRFGKLINKREDPDKEDKKLELDEQVRELLRTYDLRQLQLLASIYEGPLLRPYLTEPSFEDKLLAIFEAQVDLPFEIDELLLPKHPVQRSLFEV